VSSNLKSLEAIYGLAIEKINEVTNIFYSAKLGDGEKLQIDIVTSGSWIKSCSRKGKALIQKYMDGEDIILSTAKKMLTAANVNHEFLPPKIEFYFHNTVPLKIKKKLEQYRILVHGDVEPFLEYEIEDESSDEDSFEEILEQKSPLKVNLDTCTMITLVSNLSNGFANYEFRCEDSKFLIHLDRMAVDERQKRVLPEIVDFIRDKEIISSRTAMVEFDRITSLIAGPKEKTRVAQLKKCVKVVEDNISARIANLPSSARISERAKIAFGTGETNQAITVSSNTGFIRAARQQDVFISVKEHRPRALSEQKEASAVLLSREFLNSDFDSDYFAQIFTS